MTTSKFQLLIVNIISLKSSLFETVYKQICYYLAEGKVVLFEWSPTVFKPKFSMECHVTGSLVKRQPVLENKRSVFYLVLVEAQEYDNFTI